MRVNKKLPLESFAPYVRGFQDADHYLPELTDEVLASVTSIVESYIEERETCEETRSAILVHLKNGQYGVFQEWSDSTGHG